MKPTVDDYLRGGHYNDEGRWVRTKFCFVACMPHLCTCQPPDGVYQLPTKETPDGSKT